MNGIPYFQIILLLCCAIFYHRAAVFENESPFLWAALSVLTFLLTWLVLGYAWLGCLLGQLALLAAITLYRFIRACAPGNDGLPLAPDRRWLRSFT